jgi:ABC-type dipeptide/oligopeptide/nickel transport system ATPase component
MNIQNTFFIGIQGKAGSGKDTFAKMLMDNIDEGIGVSHRIAFADPLKRTVSELYGVELDAFYNRELKEIKMDVSVSEDRLSPRDILQQFGTQVMRNFDENFWVKRMNAEVHQVITRFNKHMFDKSLDSLNPINYTDDFLHDLEKDEDWRKSYGSSELVHVIIIPDIRFRNEQQYIIDNGGILINIKREKTDVGKMDFNHASETSIDETIKPHFNINNNQDGLVWLQLNAIQILNNLGLR